MSFSSLTLRDSRCAPLLFAVAASLHTAAASYTLAILTAHSLVARGRAAHTHSGGLTSDELNPHHHWGPKHQAKDDKARCGPREASGKHYYTNFTGGGRFWFSAAGKAVRRGLEATVNRGLTAAGGVTCPPR